MCICICIYVYYLSLSLYIYIYIYMYTHMLYVGVQSAVRPPRRHRGAKVPDGRRAPAETYETIQTEILN